LKKETIPRQIKEQGHLQWWMLHLFNKTLNKHFYCGVNILGTYRKYVYGRKRSKWSNILTAQNMYLFWLV